MDDAEPGVVDIAVDVVGEQDRRQREGQQAGRDQPPDDGSAEPRGQREDAEVGEESGPDEAEGEPGVDRRLPLGAGGLSAVDAALGRHVGIRDRRRFLAHPYFLRERQVELKRIGHAQANEWRRSAALIDARPH